MATTVISKIGATNSPLTMDFSTLQAWENALPANLVTGDTVQEGALYDQGEFTSATTLLTIAGETTDATRYINLRCATAAETGGQGASFSDKTAVRTTPLIYDATKGIGIRCTGTYVVPIVSSVNFTKFNGLQIKSLNEKVIQINNNGNIVRKCTFFRSGNGGTVVECTAQTEMYNSLIITNGSGAAYSGGRNGGLGCTVEGCTFANIGTVGNTALTFDNYGSVIVKDTAVFGFTTFIAYTGSSAGSSFNGTSSAAGFGASNQVSLTFANQFVSATADFRAVSTGSLDLNGTPDATNIPTDISGTTRSASAPTIGAWEVVPTGTFEKLVFARQAMKRSSFY